MALGSCYNCIKYLMFVFNFLFWLVGCALLAVGIWIKVDEKSLVDLIKNDKVTDSLSVLGWVIIIVGAIVMILGFLGCCGAIRESQCMLATFFVFLFVIFAALLAIAIYAIFIYDPHSEEFKDDFILVLKQDLNSYYTDKDAQKRLQYYHDKLDCCGVETGDFERMYGSANATIACGITFSTEPGCGEKAYEEAVNMFNKNMVIVIGLAFGIAVVVLLGMIFSMLLCCAIREAMS